MPNEIYYKPSLGAGQVVDTKVLNVGDGDAYAFKKRLEEQHCPVTSTEAAKRLLAKWWTAMLNTVFTVIVEGKPSPNLLDQKTNMVFETLYTQMRLLSPGLKEIPNDIREKVISKIEPQVTDALEKAGYSIPCNWK